MDIEKTATTHITMRFPADLIEVLRTFAKEDARSLHSEVLWILRDYITRRQQKQG